MKGQVLREIDAYIEAVKDRWASGYTTAGDIPSFEMVALRNAELLGAIQAAESIKDFINDQGRRLK